MRAKHCLVDTRDVVAKGYGKREIEGGAIPNFLSAYRSDDRNNDGVGGDGAGRAARGTRSICSRGVWARRWTRGR